MRIPVRHSRRLASVAAVLTLGLGLGVLAGCSADDSGSADSGAAVDEQSAPRDGDTAGGGDASAAEPGSAGVKAANGAVAVAPAVYDRKLSRRADISLTVPDVDTAAAKVRAVAAAAKGVVLAEAISSEPDAPDLGGYSTITISVPTDALDVTLDRLAALGEVHSRNASTDDVTAQYVDTESRVKTMQASVVRVRALMTQATRLADIVTLEAELSRREADLEATQAQLAALDDAVSMAPVEVRLSTDEKVLEEADDDTGFLAGLSAGWTAFTGSVTVLLTVFGAVLPFAVVLALVLVPLLVWLRRRTPGTPVAAQPAVQPPPAA